ncbi:MAG: ABC transporter permease, partial [Candidatus Methylomirabilis sp.]|nr:ABC transporter permease [Deltaproteobacteria bacterium]
LMMRLVDVLYAIPILLVLILATLFVGRSVAGIFLALGLVVWTDMARLVRGQVMQARAAPYVEAAEALGAGAPRILLRHILPNVAGPILVTLTFTIPTAILAESTLSFVGLGVAPPAASWGTLAAGGWKHLIAAPHLLFFPALAIAATILAFNTLGDALRDALDPGRERAAA